MTWSVLYSSVYSVWFVSYINNILVDTTLFYTYIGLLEITIFGWFDEKCQHFGIYWMVVVKKKRILNNYFFLHCPKLQTKCQRLIVQRWQSPFFLRSVFFRLWLWVSIYWQRCSGRSRECFGFLFVRVSARLGEADDGVHWLHPTYRRHHAYCRVAV